MTILKVFKNQLRSCQSNDVNHNSHFYVAGSENMVKRSKTHRTNVTWLRRPEYISSEPAKFKTLNGEKVEFRMERAIGKKIKSESKWEELSFLNNHKLRVKSIENSFDVASQPILEHPSKPGVFAVDVVPVFPDFGLQDHKFVEVCRFLKKYGYS